MYYQPRPRVYRLNQCCQQLSARVSLVCDPAFTVKTSWIYFRTFFRFMLNQSRNISFLRFLAQTSFKEIFFFFLILQIKIMISCRFFFYLSKHLHNCENRLGYWLLNMYSRTEAEEASHAWLIPAGGWLFSRLKKTVKVGKRWKGKRGDAEHV